MRMLLVMSSDSYRAGAFLDAARAEDVTVAVASDREQSLAPLHPAGYLTLDFRNVDDAVTTIAAFAERYPLDAVVASDDAGVLIAARAAERLGLPHAPPASVAATLDKRVMRETLARAGMDEPWFASYPAQADPVTFADQVPYPCVVKPVSLSASRGVIRADDPAAFVAAFRRSAAIARAARRNGARGAEVRLLVEEYLPGQELAVEGLVTDGRLKVLAVFDKPDPLEGPYFEETLYVTPSRLPAPALAKVTSAVADAVSALRLAHAPIHAELRWDGRRAVPLEIAARSIGGLCSRALRFRGGVSLEQALLRHALGRPLALEREPCASGVMMLPIPRAGVLSGVAGVEEARAVPGIEDVRITIPLGDRVEPLPEGARYLGFVFARADTAALVEHALRSAQRAIQLDIQPVEQGAPHR